MRPRRFRRPLTLLDVVVLTSPLLLGIGLAAASAIGDYAEARQFDDWWSRNVYLTDAFSGHVLAAVRTPGAITVRQQLDAAADDEVAIRLRVSGVEWDSQVANAFASELPWVNAVLVRSGDNRDVKVRRRGDTSVHWTTPKTSFAVRAPKGELVRGFRELALSGKDVLSAHIANSVPGEFGVRAPFTAVTPVYVNERYYGLFRAVEPIDESFLRRQGWMPGNVYRADTAERGEYFKDLPRNVFNNPYIWDRVANGADTDEAAQNALRSWIEDGALSRFEDHQRFMARVDRDATARLLASMLVVGDPYHMSGVHNHFWFEDPSTGLLTPLPWDLRLLDLAARTTDPLNTFFTLALRDPFMTDQALALVHRAAEDGLIERLEAELDETTARFKPHLKFEHLRRELVSSPGDPVIIRNVLRRNHRTLTEWAADARVGFYEGPAGGYRILDFEIRGFAGAELVGLRVEGSPDLRLYMDTDLDGVRSAGDAPVAIDVAAGETRLRDPIALFAGWRHDALHFVPGRIHYRLFLEGVAPGASVTALLRNRVTGDPVDPVEVIEGESLGDAFGFHPWRFRTPAGRTIRLAGQVGLTETMRLSARDTLVISPGTRVVLDPDVSIVSRGLVIAEGTPARPIEFVPGHSALPWGAVALQGSGADGSRFAYTRFVRGGGAREGRIDFKGMVTIHRARRVDFAYATFEDNLRSDDALNAVHSEVHLSGCVFRRANSDAIDFDYSTGSIVGCTIEDSRNDGIDLMTSSPLIRSNRLFRNSDKGISIGEASHPLIVDNHLADGNRGLEIKDRSYPVVLHNTIEGNAVGILSNVKNWRYAGGGAGLVALSRVSGNTVELDRDALSTLSIIGSPIGTAPASDVGTLPRWVHEAHGLAAGPTRPGALGETATWVTPRAPLWMADFRAAPVRFYDASEWDGDGQIRLREADGRLSVRVGRGDARWGRSVDWDLSEGGEFVAELTGQDVVSLRVVFTREDGEFGVDVPVEAEPGRIGIETVDVPPGRYRYVRFEMAVDEGVILEDPTTGLLERRGGRVDVYRLRLFQTGESR